MKTLFTITLLCILSFAAYSQDKIVKNSGEGIECKISKEDSSSVYFTFLKDGREIETYIDKSQVKEIIYESKTSKDPIFYKKEFDKYVYFQNGNKLNMNQISNILKSNNESYSTFDSARELNSFANILACAGGAMVGWPVGSYIAGGEPNWNLALIGGGMILIAVPISIGALDKMNRAIDIYNDELKSSSIKSELKFGISGNGLKFQFIF